MCTLTSFATSAVSVNTRSSRRLIKPCQPPKLVAAQTRQRARTGQTHAANEAKPSLVAPLPRPSCKQLAQSSAWLAPASVGATALSAARIVQDPTFRVLFAAAGAFAGALASDRYINETGSVAIMPMGAVLGAAVGLLLPKLAANPFLAMGLLAVGVLSTDFARRTMTGSAEDVGEMSKIAGLGAAVGVGMLWP